MHKNKAFSERTTFLEENFLSTGSFFRKINKCILMCNDRYLGKTNIEAKR